MSDTPLRSSESSDVEQSATPPRVSPLSDVQAQVQDQAKRVADAAGQVGRAIVDQTGAVRDWANERAGTARDWALDQSDVFRDTVQVNPFVSIGLSSACAFAAGLAIGLVLTRR